MCSSSLCLACGSFSAPPPLAAHALKSRQWEMQKKIYHTPKSPVQSSVFMINNTTVHWWMQYWSSELYFHFPRVQICLSATQTMNAETLRVPLDQHLREINVWSMYDAFFNPEQNISQAFTKTLWCMSEVCPQVTWLEVESDHKSGDKKKGTSNLTFPLVPMTCTLTSDIPQIRELEIYPTI